MPGVSNWIIYPILFLIYIRSVLYWSIMPLLSVCESNMDTQHSWGAKVKLPHRVCYLQSKESNSYHPQPGVERVQVGNGWYPQVVGVKHCYCSHHNAWHSHQVKEGVQNLGSQLVTASVQPVHQHGCKKQCITLKQKKVLEICSTCFNPSYYIYVPILILSRL